MSENLAVRWMCRYKVFFLLGLLIIGVQVFLAYKSLGLNTVVPDRGGSDLKFAAAGIVHPNNPNSVSDDEDASVSAQKRAAHGDVLPQSRTGHKRLTTEQLGFVPQCEITAKEAISALQRAKSIDCRKHIAHVACSIQVGKFYAHHLPSHCPAGNKTTNVPLGCYRDEKDFRLLAGYFINFKTSNSPIRCTQLCLQSGFPYAGVQYGSECFCGVDSPPKAAKLPDSSCNMKCTGASREVCGGYFSMNIYETGIAKFTAKIAETSVKPEIERVKIAFLLTLNGRAVRQVHRLLKALYSPNHVFYIHVDARQDYLFRQLVDLETKFRNIRLARKRFSTIWGGASLLTMLLQCMEDLLANTDWQWDFVINLSESDFPVKSNDKLVDFLTANKGRNFVKSHGRETQRFIQKQGLDKTFVECDTHMWRIGDRQLPTGIQLDGGSDWVALSRNFVEYISTQSQNDALLQGLLNIFRYTLLPAESFFHTVLRNSHFCDAYVDNNLHITNWKRKLGCKCQYKHVVDWCGCSPNDFKPDDWSRLQGTENKMIFFARKFEPIINQAILLQLEEWIYGPYTSDYINLHSYWQSMYHVDDAPTITDDLVRTIGDSLIRIVARQKQLRPGKLIEMTHYKHQDEYKGFLLRYEAAHLTKNLTIELETRIKPVQYAKIAKNSKFGRRLRNFEVSSDYDQKEQMARNFAKLLGPHTELVLSFTLLGAGSVSQNDLSHSYNLTLLWIDPAGRLQEFNELHVEDSQTDAINYSKALLKKPLKPGIWTVKLIGRTAIYAQAKFLVAPFAFHEGQPISAERARILNVGAELSLPKDFLLPAEWLPHLPAADEAQLLLQLAKTNGQRTNGSLLAWIDDLIGKFFIIRETCVAKTAAAEAVSNLALTLCHETTWSSMAPDPKSVTHCSNVDEIISRN